MARPVPGLPSGQSGWRVTGRATLKRGFGSRKRAAGARRRYCIGSCWRRRLPSSPYRCSTTSPCDGGMQRARACRLCQFVIVVCFRRRSDAKLTRTAAMDSTPVRQDQGGLTPPFSLPCQHPATNSLILDRGSSNWAVLFEPSRCARTDAGGPAGSLERELIGLWALGGADFLHRYQSSYMKAESGRDSPLAVRSNTGLALENLLGISKPSTRQFSLSVSGMVSSLGYLCSHKHGADQERTDMASFF
jgi:hypothetical protein